MRNGAYQAIRQEAEIRPILGVFAGTFQTLKLDKDYLNQRRNFWSIGAAMAQQPKLELTIQASTNSAASNKGNDDHTGSESGDAAAFFESITTSVI